MHGLCSTYTPRLLKPYVEMIASVLLPKLKEENPHVASCALAALGELSAAGGADMKPYLDQLVPLIINTLQDMVRIYVAGF